MRLKKLYVDNYKNLKGFSIYFESESGLSILVGNNGSGKSNILEVISGIFHDLYKEKIDRKIKCNYTLEYSLDGVECKIENRNGTVAIYISQQRGGNIIRRELFAQPRGPGTVEPAFRR